MFGSTQCAGNIVPTVECGKQRKLSYEAREDFGVAVNGYGGEELSEGELGKLVKTSLVFRQFVLVCLRKSPGVERGRLAAGSPCK